MGSLLFLCAAAGALATPFDDVRGRFSLDLPAGWTFAPQPGQVSGATFVRRIRGAPATFSVQIMPIGPTTTLDAFVAAVSAGMSRTPGYQLVQQEHGRLAGLSTLRRRYVLSKPAGAGGATTAEDWFAVFRGQGYVIHGEGPSDGFGVLAADFAHLRASLRFAGIDPAAPSPHPAHLIGRWLMVGTADTVFDLKADGTFDLDGTPGVWRSTGKTLLTRPLGGEAEAFTWRFLDQELELSGANLDAPIRYRRTEAKQPKLAPLPKSSPLGLWSAPGYTVDVKTNNRIVLNGRSGTYVEADGVWIMRLGPKKQRLVVEFELSKKTLVLKGEVFGSGVTFERR